MALESANFIDGLVITNPPGTDLKSQGDDHLQLIKKVLKNTFPNATRPFPIPTALTVSGSGSLIAANQNALIIVANGAAMNLTMPVLTTGDAGWSVNVLKLPGSVGPLFVLPPSGNIISGQTTVAKARRNIPGVQFQVLWTGSNWVCGRCVNGPVGSVVPFFMAGLPPGFEWPNGQTLVAADYPEYAALRGSGTTPDLRERTVFGTNMGLASPGRINTVIAPTLENAGGSQFLHLHNHAVGVAGKTNTEDTLHTHSGRTHYSSVSGFSMDHTHTETSRASTAFMGSVAAGPQGWTGDSTPQTGFNSTSGYTLDHYHLIDSSVLGTQSANHRHDIADAGTGNQQNMPPTLICNYVLVVE